MEVLLTSYLVSFAPCCGHPARPVSPAFFPFGLTVVLHLKGFLFSHAPWRAVTSYQHGWPMIRPSWFLHGSSTSVAQLFRPQNFFGQFFLQISLLHGCCLSRLLVCCLFSYSTSLLYHSAGVLSLVLHLASVLSFPALHIRTTSASRTFGPQLFSPLMFGGAHCAVLLWVSMGSSTSLL